MKLSYEDILVRARKAMEGVTKGPWETRALDDGGDQTSWSVVLPLDAEGSEIGDIQFTNIHDNEESDARFVAWCRDGVPELIHEVEMWRHCYDQTVNSLTQTKFALEDRIKKLEADVAALNNRTIGLMKFGETA